MTILLIPLMSAMIILFIAKAPHKVELFYNSTSGP